MGCVESPGDKAIREKREAERMKRSMELEEYRGAGIKALREALKTREDMDKFTPRQLGNLVAKALSQAFPE